MASALKSWTPNTTFQVLTAATASQQSLAALSCRKLMRLAASTPSNAFQNGLFLNLYFVCHIIVLI
eukprot:scaffold185912_cov13-Prasinocladus_malaysianus.AAC.1